MMHVKLKFTKDGLEEEVWFPCYFDGGNALILDMQQWERDLRESALASGPDDPATRRENEMEAE